MKRFMFGLRPGVTLGKLIHLLFISGARHTQMGSHLCWFENRQTEQALSDLNEAIKVAPAGRDVRKVLLKAIEETESVQRLPGNAGGLTLMETSSDTIQDCCSSGVGSSLTSASERG